MRKAISLESSFRFQTSWRACCVTQVESGVVVMQASEPACRILNRNYTPQLTVRISRTPIIELFLQLVLELLPSGAIQGSGHLLDRIRYRRLSGIKAVGGFIPNRGELRQVGLNSLGIHLEAFIGVEDPVRF